MVICYWATMLITLRFNYLIERVSQPQQTQHNTGPGDFVIASGVHMTFPTKPAAPFRPPVDPLTRPHHILVYLQVKAGSLSLTEIRLAHTKACELIEVVSCKP